MKSLIAETFRHWKSHNAPRMGAALSYYTMLSFVPLLVLLTTAVGMLFNKDLVQGTLATELAGTLGTGAAEYIDSLLRGIELQNISLFAAVVSAVIMVFGAMGVFSELDKDLDELWDVVPVQKIKKSWIASVVSAIRSKIIALSFIPILGILLFVFIIVALAFSSIKAYVAFLPIFATLIQIAQIIVPLILGTLLFAIVYRILPSRRLPWSVVLLGALVTTLLFIIGNVCIITYIQVFLHINVFGAAASLVGLLVWVYYSAQVFFIGASFTYIYAKRNGLIPEREIEQ